MISTIVFTTMFVGIGAFMLVVGIYSTHERYKVGYRRWNVTGYPLAIFCILFGIVCLVLGSWYPFAIQESNANRAVFDEQCHSRGGSVVELENNDYECWKERIEL